jgi:pimeloyl-ACP methyl ester carboxylesterase
MPTEHFIEVNGARLFVREQGEGLAVVLSQPGLLSGAVYEALMWLLAERFRVIAFDTRGHGQSTNPDGELSYELVADDTAALIKVMELDRPFVGGWSDGGEVALQVARRHPDLVRGVLAGGTSLEMGGNEETRRKQREFFHSDADNVVDFDVFMAEHGDGFVPFLRQWHPHDEEQLQEVIRWSAVMWVTYAGLSGGDLARITAPTLVVTGELDEFVPPEQSVRLYRSLPHAELAILPGSDHMRPVFEPACLAPFLIDFMSRHNG